MTWHRWWRGGFLLLLALCQVFSSSPVAGAPPLSPWDFFTISYQVKLSKSVVKQGESFSAIATGSATCKQPFPVPITIIVTVNSRVIATNQTTNAQVALNPGYSVRVGPFPNEIGKSFQVDEVVPLSFPPTAEYGTYTVTGYLIKATLAGAFDISSYLPSEQDMGAVSYVAASGVGGGLGGGGGSPPTTPQPTPVAIPQPTRPVALEPRTTELTTNIGSDGVATSRIEAFSNDNNCVLGINTGTKALDNLGNPLSRITVTPLPTPPAPPPAQSNMIGTPYDLGPSGATFSPPVTVALHYDPGKLPAGTSKSQMRAVVFNPLTGRYDLVPDQIADTANNFIAIKLSHFSTYGIIAYPAAKFNIGNLSVDSKEPVAGDQVTIRATVSNTGGLDGTYQVTLKIDNQTVETKSLTLPAGDTLPVSFTVTPPAGNHTIDVNGLSASLKVSAPASFLVSGLSISPDKATPSAQVTITALVTNTGDIAGTYQAILKIDNAAVANQSVSLAGKAQQTVSFKVSRDKAGSYQVDIGGVTGSFAVQTPAVTPSTPAASPTPAPPPPTSSAEPPPPPSSNPWLMVVIGAIVVLGVVGYFGLKRRKTEKGPDKDQNTPGPDIIQNPPGPNTDQNLPVPDIKQNPPGPDTDQNPPSLDTNQSPPKQ